MSTWVLLAAAAVLSCAFTWAARLWALRVGTLDVPSDRSSHTTPTPRLGGVALFLVAGAFAWRPSILAISVGATLFFVVGLLDDLRARGRGLDPRLKLLLQAVAAAVPVALGVRFEGRENAAYGAVDLGPLAAPMTALWFVAVVNVVNFMDGIDAISAVTSGAILGAAALATVGVRSDLGVVSVGAIAGFLVWNLSRRKIFLGDGGSHLLGFLVAAAACSAPDATGGAATHGAPWALVAAPLVPSIVDVAEALVHKVRHGIPLSQPHNDHLYQRLTKAGSSHVAVAIRYGLLAAIACVLVGPFADRAGLVASLAACAVVLAAHLWAGARTTRSVPRMQAAPR